MNVLLVIQHVNYFRALDPVVRVLHRRGHQVAVLHGGGAQKRNSSVQSGRGLESTQGELHGLYVEYRGVNLEKWHGTLSMGRQIVNASRYMRSDHPSPHRGEGLERRFPEGVKRWLARPWVRRLVRTNAALSLWRRIEAASPASPGIMKQIEAFKPDVMLVCPTIWPKDPSEADYIHAAKALGIPTAGFVASWDNLTSKGTIQVFPDVLMVWNRALAQEAVDLHQIPQSILRIVGAPYLDRWFNLRPSVGVADVCRRVGLPEHKPYVLYFCTSPTLISSELHIVSALADALDRIGNPVGILVRPHPTNAIPWDGFNDPRVVVHPRGGDLADTTETWQEYYDMVASASSVIGLNTTAFLEAVVADRPCMTLIDPQHHLTQGATGHFRHLVAGDFMEIATSVDELAAMVARAGQGVDVKRDGRRAFLESFLRPCGVGVPASDVVADVLTSLARPSSVTHAGDGPRVDALMDPVPGLAFRPSAR